MKRTNILKEQSWAFSTGGVASLVQVDIVHASGGTFLSACALCRPLFSPGFYLFMLLLQFSLFLKGFSLGFKGQGCCDEKDKLFV